MDYGSNNLMPKRVQFHSKNPHPGLVIFFGWARSFESMKPEFEFNKL